MADPIEIQLNDKLVLKNFGQRPWIGRRLRLHTIRSTAGVRWKQKRVKTKDGNWIPIGDPYIVRDELTTDVVIALTPIRGRRGWWRVSVDPRWYEQAMDWLINTVGEGAPSPKRRRRTKHNFDKMSNWGRVPMKVDNG